jgi:hypothetical protein
LEGAVTDLAKLRFVTEHYAQLQGLRLLPVGLVFLGLAAWQSSQFQWMPAYDSDRGSRWFVGALVLAVIGAYVIGAFYRRQFGSVQPRRFRTGGPSLLANATIVGLLVIFQSFVPAPVSLPMLYVALVLAYTGVVQHGLRKHYLFIAVACLLFASLPSFDVSYQIGKVLLNLLIGVGLIVAGVGDHLVLRKTLRPVPRQTHVDTPV